MCMGFMAVMTVAVTVTMAMRVTMIVSVTMTVALTMGFDMRPVLQVAAGIS